VEDNIKPLQTQDWKEPDIICTPTLIDQIEQQKNCEYDDVLQYPDEYLMEDKIINYINSAVEIKIT
jgi:hypothetical protein